MDSNLVERSDDGFTYKCIGCQQWIPVSEEMYLPSLDGCFCSSCVKTSDHKEPCGECENPFSLHELTWEVDSEWPLCRACEQSWRHNFQVYLDKLGLSPRKLALTQMLCHAFLVKAGFKIELPKQFKWGISVGLLLRLSRQFDQWDEASSCPLEVRVADLVDTDQLVRQMRHSAT